MDEDHCLLAVVDLPKQGTRVNASSINSIITAVVEKLPDRVRIDLASRDPFIRQCAEDEVSTRIKAAIGEVHAFC